jgi:hypothetical protein
MVGVSQTNQHKSKRPLGSEFFIVIKSIVEDESRRAASSQESLREVLLQSVVTQPPDVDWKINHNIALNVKEYTESVYFEGLSKWLIKGKRYFPISTTRANWICRPHQLAYGDGTPSIGFGKQRRI